jgi:hypothetical protein
LKEAEGEPVKTVCARHNLSQATYYQRPHSALGYLTPAEFSRRQTKTGCDRQSVALKTGALGFECFFVKMFSWFPFKCVMNSTISIIASLALAFAASAAMAEDQTKTVVAGEVLDLGCYLEFGSTGPQHAACARKCIEGGRPAGLKGTDGKIYLLIGPEQTLNRKIAAYAGKNVSIRGIVVRRDGINAIENAELVGGVE